MTLEPSRLTDPIPPRDPAAIGLDAYPRLVGYPIGNDSHGILANATTAAPSNLTLDECNALVDVAMKSVGGRIPVVTAIGSQSLAKAETLTDHAVQPGTGALLIVAPD